MKKNIIITLIVLTIAATITACGGGSNNVSPDDSYQADQQQAEVFVIPIGGMIIFPLQEDAQDPPPEWHNKTESLEVWWEKSFDDPVYPFAGWRIKGVREDIVEMYDTKGNLLMVIYITDKIDDEYVILADTTN